MRKMPIGVQSFAELRNNDNVYVDKTALIYKLAQDITPYFLARPRRFGKSLLISTLEAYFKGKRELFSGLAMEQLEQDWAEFPVFHIDLTGSEYREPDDIKTALGDNLLAIEQKWGATDHSKPTPSRFATLIAQASKQAGKNVVVLIDEYDKPLLESLDDIELNTYYLNTLRAFYGVLKKMSAHLRFTLLTGVTKFSKVSVFSDLNQLRDISLNDDYAALCGITGQELQAIFEPELQELAKKEDISYDQIIAKTKQLYDGYHFSKNSPDVYNPFSVLNALANQDFGYYWFKTGTPTFLLKLIEQSNFDTMQFQSGIKVSENSLDDYRAGSTNPVPILYQSGYLTIQGWDSQFREYTLGFPNEEVEYGFLEALLPVYLPAASDTNGLNATNLVKDLLAQDIDAFFTRLKALFASLPYGHAAQHEHYYQSLFYMVFTLMGQFVKVEEHTHKGRSDAVVQTKDAIYIFEFKLSSVDGDAAINEALQQIEDNGYAEPYAASPKGLYKIAVQFDPKQRNITNWQVA